MDSGSWGSVGKTHVPLSFPFYNNNKFLYLGSELYARPNSGTLNFVYNISVKRFIKSANLWCVKAGSHVRRNDASTSASARRRKDFLFLALALMLASSRFTRPFSCACACACAYACVVASYVWTSLEGSCRWMNGTVKLSARHLRFGILT